MTEKRHRPSQGTIDYLEGQWEKIQDDRLYKCMEPVYLNPTTGENETVTSLLKEILHLSDVEKCQDSDDLQRHLEKIHTLIVANYPNLMDLEEAD
jgi:hypothetical protein